MHLMKSLVGLAGTMLSASAFAMKKVSLATSEGSIFSKPTEMMQEWIDFVQGPAGYAAVFLGCAIGVILWMAAPKENKIMGYVVRAIAGGVLIATGGVWIAKLWA